MADQTLMDFLSGPVMTQIANSPTIVPGIPYFLPEAFRTPSGSPQPVGPNLKWLKFNGDRTQPPLVHQNSTSQTRDTTGAQWEYGTALGSKSNFVVDQEMLYALMSPIPYVAANAKFEYNRRFEGFKTQLDSMKTTAVHSMVLTGKIYAGTQITGTTVGNAIQTSSTNANITVLAGGLNNSSQIFTSGTAWKNTSTNVGDWSSAATDIPSSLRALRQGFLKTSNYNPAIILYGRNIPSYFAANTLMQTFMSRQPQINREFQDTNEVPKGLLDFDWVPAYNAYFQDPAGTLTTWLGDDNIVIIPKPDPNWYEYIPASTLVPMGTMPAVLDPETMISTCRPVPGRFSYATSQLDPIGYKAIVGEYFLPVIKNGLVHWIATVK